MGFQAKHIPKRVLQALVRLYQLTLRPYLGQQCRFYPTCSDYAMTALEDHGALRGSYLATHRIFRCQPFHPGGCDPVPEKE